MRYLIFGCLLFAAYFLALWALICLVVLPLQPLVQQGLESVDAFVRANALLLIGTTAALSASVWLGRSVLTWVRTAELDESPPETDLDGVIWKRKRKKVRR